MITQIVEWNVFVNFKYQLYLIQLLTSCIMNRLLTVLNLSSWMFWGQWFMLWKDRFRLFGIGPWFRHIWWKVMFHMSLLFCDLVFSIFWLFSNFPPQRGVVFRLYVKIVYWGLLCVLIVSSETIILATFRWNLV